MIKAYFSESATDADLEHACNEKQLIESNLHKTIFPAVLFMNGLNQSIKKLNVKFPAVIVNEPILCYAGLSQISFMTIVSGEQC